MKRALLATVVAMGVAVVVGCGSDPAPPVAPAAANGGPPPKDSGAGGGAKKGSRIPANPK
ncbi:hypothetical protein J0H58_20500 [bacterium]|nr:hypothetical protein [bacterium]